MWTSIPYLVNLALHLRLAVLERLQPKGNVSATVIWGSQSHSFKRRPHFPLVRERH